MAPPPAAQSVPRSGDVVLATAERLAPLMALLAPFLAGLVAWLNAHLQYTHLDANYVEVLKGAVAAYLPVLVARWHMRQVRRGYWLWRPPVPVDPDRLE